jgi:hypothetical protein
MSASSPVQPRRSSRLATKEPIKYFTEEERLEDLIKYNCKKNGFPYSDDLIAEYKSWRPGAPLGYTHKFISRDYYDNAIYGDMLDIETIVASWVKWASSARLAKGIERMIKQEAKMYAKLEAKAAKEAKGDSIKRD